MQRPVFTFALLAAATAVLAPMARAQQQQQPATPPSAYEGVSNPPSDTIISDEDQPATTHAPILLPNAKRPQKPAAGTLMNPPASTTAQTVPMQTVAQTPPVQQQVLPVQQAIPAQQDPTQQAYVTTQTAPAPAYAATPYPAQQSIADPDGDIVHPVAPPPAYPVPAPVLATRQDYNGPDNDMVHPMPGAVGEITEGTTIRVHLLERLSTSEAHSGDHFRTSVAQDVLSNGQIIIPTGAEITGQVVSASDGKHLGGRGSMRLKPESVTLPNGMRFEIRAETTGTPGTNVRLGAEGTIKPGSQAKKDGIQYGSVAGAGVITGAILGGPVGALAGGLVGAGVVTAHILVTHPQATLEPGSTLLFTLTQPLYMTAPAAGGNE